MIGHNLDEIDLLIDEIDGSYVSLGETLVSGWPTVTGVLETEWIGPDEKSFEEQLANKVKELFLASKQSFLDMATNINNIGKGWVEFQNQNIISGATAGNLDHAFKTPNLDDVDVSSAIKVTPFATSGGQKYGVVNGQESATAINNALTSYITSIQDKLTELGSGLSASSAFLGESQAEAIEEYMRNVTKYVGALIGLVSELQPVLDQLVKNYIEQAQAFTKAAQTASSDLSSQTVSTAPTDMR